LDAFVPARKECSRGRLSLLELELEVAPRLERLQNRDPVLVVAVTAEVIAGIAIEVILLSKGFELFDLGFKAFELGCKLTRQGSLGNAWPCNPKK